MSSSKKILIEVLSLFQSDEAFSQPKDLKDLSLEELMDVKVTEATDTEKSLREAPGINSVISDDQIKLLGARDLMEVLATVPGITFGHDVLGNFSIIMREIWAQEGRILLLIDGLELANHFPAEHIKRVEIIRSPGSAIYGGFAELGVINFITKNIILWGDLENSPGSGNIRKPVPKEYPTDVYQLGFRGDVSENLNLNLYYQDKVQLPYIQPYTKNEVEFANSGRRDE